MYIGGQGTPLVPDQQSTDLDRFQLELYRGSRVCVEVGLI